MRRLLNKVSPLLTLIVVMGAFVGAVAAVELHLRAVQTHNVRSLRASCLGSDRRVIIEILHIDWPIYTSNVAASHDPTESAPDRRNRGNEAQQIFAGMKLLVADRIDTSFAKLLPQSLAKIVTSKQHRFSCVAAYHLP
jgi:hypothetical protein